MRIARWPAVAAFVMVVRCAAPVAADDAPARVSSARIPSNGVRVHDVQSEFQSAATEIRVLLPSDLKPDERYSVLFVLPVEAADGQRWGDSIEEVLRHDLHNKFKLICVFPTFSALPWSADHPTAAGIRQESYLLRVVVPFVEKEYPAKRGRAGRLLVGFSKSGWGAWSLLLRHPDIFHKAAAWDAPLMLAEHDRYGAGPIFGTPENFEAYRVSKLLDPRLVLLGHGGFKDDHDRAHRLLDQLAVPHVYREGPKREHSWHSGWLPEAVELLVRDAAALD
jgi:hypothetical protein